MAITRWRGSAQGGCLPEWQKGVKPLPCRSRNYVADGKYGGKMIKVGTQIHLFCNLQPPSKQATSRKCALTASISSTCYGTVCCGLSSELLLWLLIRGVTVLFGRNRLFSLIESRSFEVLRTKHNATRSIDLTQRSQLMDGWTVLRRSRMCAIRLTRDVWPTNTWLWYKFSF